MAFIEDLTETRKSKITSWRSVIFQDISGSCIPSPKWLENLWKSSKLLKRINNMYNSKLNKHTSPLCSRNQEQSKNIETYVFHMRKLMPQESQMQEETY